MDRYKILLVISFISIPFAHVYGAIIRVPGDEPTIQAGIDAAGPDVCRAAWFDPARAGPWNSAAFGARSVHDVVSGWCQDSALVDYRSDGGGRDPDRLEPNQGIPAATRNSRSAAIGAVP